MNIEWYIPLVKGILSSCCEDGLISKQDLLPHNGYNGVSFFRQVVPIFIQENLQF